MNALLYIDKVSSAGTALSRTTLRLAEGKYSIGRLPGSDVVLEHPDVSAKHALLEVKGSGQLSISDLGSSNGTYLETKRLTVGVSLPLAPGSRVVIGQFILTVEFESSQKVEPPEEEKALSEEGDVAGLTDTAASYESVLSVKRRIHDLLIERLELRRRDIISLSDEALREQAKQVVQHIIRELRWQIPSGLQRERLVQEILDEALGLGPLEDLLREEAVSEIMVNSFDSIYVEREGRIAQTALRFSSENAVLAAIERILAPIGRRIDESSPLVDARLKDGSRVNAVIRPLALQGPCITIRKFARTPLSIEDLVKYGTLSEGMAGFLDLAVKHRRNIVISGGTGSGKTTLLNVIASFVPEGQRIITVEDAAELKLPQEHVIAFETRPPNLEGKGAITIRDLVRNALRMRPDRIIVGECRGGEALDMLQAMNTGHDGSMTTGHANSPEDMLRRLETMVLISGLDLPMRAVREQIASAVDLIVQQTRFSCGSRRITSISEVVGMDPDEGVVVMQEIFGFQQQGYTADGGMMGRHMATGYIPKFFRELQARHLTVNANVFSPD